MQVPPSAVAWKNSHLARALAKRREGMLSDNLGLTRKSYTTENYIKRHDWRTDNYEHSMVHRDRHCHLVDCPTDELTILVKDLYQLCTVDRTALDSNAIARDVQSALHVLAQCEATYSIVSSVVWSIVVVTSNSPDTDVSYSDPRVPFSIFVSVPPRESETRTLRLAESILHESMHLYLTLIEQETPILTSSGNSSMSYSPWRDCLRPLNGVLHGAFVFRAIHDFFAQLLVVNMDLPVRIHSQSRLAQIGDDFRRLRLFDMEHDFTPFGTSLMAEITNIPDTSLR